MSTDKRTGILDNFKADLQGIGLELRAITAESEEDDYRLRYSNDYYYFRVEGHLPTPEECKKTRYMLPEDADPRNQIYAGLYGEDGRCRAIVELLAGYPQESELNLVWLMLDKAFQGQGLGSRIMQAIFGAAEGAGFESIRLCCYDVNEIGKAFWKKQGFSCLKETVRETGAGNMRLLVLEKHL
jgi:GNAT superfamily N-acetyltransferase